MASPATVGAGGSRFLLDHFSLADKVANRSAALTALACCYSLRRSLPFGRGPAIRALLLFSALALYFLERALAEKFRAHDGAFVCRALALRC